MVEVDSPNIGGLLDTYHMNIEENSIGDAVRLVGAERMKNFHTGENNRTLRAGGIWIGMRYLVRCTTSATQVP